MSRGWEGRREATFVLNSFSLYMYVDIILRGQEMSCVVCSSLGKGPGLKLTECLRVTLNLSLILLPSAPKCWNYKCGLG